jgi:Ca-activated chloride channel family protein
MSRLIGLTLALAVALSSQLVGAQGFLIVNDDQYRLPRPIVIWPPHPPFPRPRPPVPPPIQYKISELDIQARLIDQVAQVQVSQSFVNTGSRPLEAAFVFPLPYDGAVEQMTLLVDGKEYPARLLKAEDARRMYEDIVRRNRDPALLEWLGTGLFKTSVFPVPPGAKRTVTLRYSQLCRRSAGLVDFLFPLSTAKYTSEPVDRVGFRLSIESPAEIKNVYSPTHPVEIRRPDPQHAVITLTQRSQIPSSDFRLLYDVGQGQLSARVLSYRPRADEDGYFLLLASPEIKAAKEEPARKTVVFVVDRSGSMSGKKLEQARAGAKFILDTLRTNDRFNIIAYDNQVESFRPEPQRCGPETRQAALGFIDGLFSGGSTDINAALATALGQLRDSKQPSYVIFLTDGLPTAGVTNEMQIAANARAANKVRARLFVFGVGYDVNSRLLEKMAREGFGYTQYVRPEEDIESSIGKLASRIESPVMTDVRLEFALDESGQAGPVATRLYPKGPLDLFAGEQLAVVGRYHRSGAARVVVRGTVAGHEQKLEFPAELVAQSNDEGRAFVEKLWAVRRVGEILEEIDLSGKNQELLEELVGLSTRHGILTPYTSFLADEAAHLHDVTGNVRRTGERLKALNQVSGYGGVAQRAMRGDMKRAQFAPAEPMALAPAALATSTLSGAGAMSAGAPLAAAKPADSSLFGKAERESQQAQQTMRFVANRAFYRRDGRWVDATVTKAQETQVQRVKQFSTEYFELARRHGRELTQYLVFDEPVLVGLGGQAYLVEP